MVASPSSLPRLPQALLLDAMGTLLHPRESIGQVYAMYARRFRVELAVDAIDAALPVALARLRPLRAHSPTWIEYWSAVIAEVTGCADARLTRALMLHFGSPDAWRLAAGALECIRGVRRGGMKVAVVSNWDVRLAALLDAFGVSAELDAVTISGLVGSEKPDSVIFLHTCQQLRVEPELALHVGDDPQVDVAGARQAGLMAWQFGVDVRTFADLERHLTQARGGTLAGSAPTFVNTWDFYGDDARATAEHFQRHLEAFIVREQLQGCMVDLEDHGVSRASVRCFAVGGAQIAVERGLRPPRTERT